MRNYDDYDDGCDFADPGGRSALRAAGKGNPRNLPCPNRQQAKFTPTGESGVLSKRR